MLSVSNGFFDHPEPPEAWGIHGRPELTGVVARPAHVPMGFAQAARTLHTGEAANLSHYLEYLPLSVFDGGGGGGGGGGSGGGGGGGGASFLVNDLRSPAATAAAAARPAAPPRPPAAPPPPPRGGGGSPGSPDEVPVLRNGGTDEPGKLDISNHSLHVARSACIKDSTYVRS